ALTCSVSDLAQNSWAQAIRRAQPPRQLGLQARATAPGARSPLRRRYELLQR
uniref:Uncharacterized protein n=1 Tax=Ficedula albicollis TaxID=59894 RepID=A0A803W5L8_FICAL